MPLCRCISIRHASYTNPRLLTVTGIALDHAAQGNTKNAEQNDDDEDDDDDDDDFICIDSINDDNKDDAIKQFC